MKTEKPEINHLAVYLSMECNMSCSYCHYGAGTGSPVISEKKLFSAIRRFLREDSSFKKITFLGGEPLLHFGLLKKAVLLSRRLDPGVIISVFTNGSLFSESKNLFLKKKGVKIILSADGPKKTNDRNRKFRNSGASVYDFLFSRLKPEETGSLTVNMVVTPASAGSLAENIRFFYGKGFRSIGWNMDYSRPWKPESLKKLRRSLLQALLDYLRLMKAGLEVYEISNCYELIEELSGGAKPGCFTVSLFPDGNFYFCDKTAGSPDSSALLWKGGPEAAGERRDFFSELEKKGAPASGLICRAGIYIYFKFVKCMKGRALKKDFLRASRAAAFAEKEKKEMIKVLLKYSPFRKAHNL